MFMSSKVYVFVFVVFIPLKSKESIGYRHHMHFLCGGLNSTCHIYVKMKAGRSYKGGS
jgi:hypothetical protein